MLIYALNAVNVSSFVPHAAIRCKVYEKEELQHAPSTFKYIDPIGKEFYKDHEAYTLQSECRRLYWM
jgi:N-acyl-D-aspartate/D-glutamate deacylase